MIAATDRSPIPAEHPVTVMPETTALNSFSLSLIIPAYREGERFQKNRDIGAYTAGNLLKTLRQSRDYLQQNYPGRYEIIVIEDGYLDNTTDLVNRARPARYEITHEGRIQLVTLPQNRGKGAAVRTGLNLARGDFIGFMDADGSVPVTEMDKLYRRLAATPEADVAIAQRGHKTDAHDGWKARLAHSIFHYCTQAIAPSKVPDTQCGGKVFTHEAAKSLGHLEHGYRSDRFEFDAEMLNLAYRAGMKILPIEVDVTPEPSRFNRVTTGLQMLGRLSLVSYENRRSQRHIAVHKHFRYLLAEAVN